MPRCGAQPCLGADGEPLIYPAPVVLRNTFVDVQIGRPLSLEGFFQEREACSCPTSLISEPGADMPGIQLAKEAPAERESEDFVSNCSTAEPAEEPVKTLPLLGARPVIRLDDALPSPVLGSPELPSIGSIGHSRQECKPCAFVLTKGCASGMQCKFCHLCEPGERKKRQKEKRQFFGAVKRMQRFVADSAWWS